MNEQPYLIPSASALFEEEIKKSVFITHLAHTPSVETAKQFVEQVKKEHSSARHNCWGFVVGRPEDSMLWGFSDDGEPSGTAGKPILAQLSGSGVGELTAVVTRYSGGIKLGTGGLVKAYGGGVQQALKLLQTIEKKITTKLRLELDYGFVPIAQSIMAQHQAVEVQADYGVQVELIIEIELLQVDSFTQTMINKSGAKALVTKVKDN
ncbi:YigZ family protein [Vibrio crassostreae]|uniref:IMPACT family member yigZ n=1 Tax=Vibrio crassostreae TaxID=246167 RepID=A0ABP1WVN7_9VIBR|nr:YigZ family protein [Vibrio crassostreae]TCL21555.1 putative YigZ family protein [Vibrio crassostreae]TCN96212.1 putative YigZ family protein [Vibrio crassostreae]TCT45444.1 putative YigZ family protein [Vibrio crassostreae]TCT47324.1 putative YigZ family protein [Vibrio crassostreae]TCT51225.1 putative YigZ family protein [Vibrio crassostreae]